MKLPARLPVFSITRKLLVLLLFTVLISCEDEMSEDVDISDPSLAYSGSGEGGGSRGVPGNSSGNIPAGQITAGEWSDLANWDYWQDLQQHDGVHESRQTWGLDATRRVQIQVVDLLNFPLIDARVQLLDNQNQLIWESRTDNRGSAEVWNGALSPQESSIKLLIEYKGVSNTIEAPKTMEEGVNFVALPTKQTCPDMIDLMFVVDATGSMGDEMEYLKAEVSDVVARIAPTAGVRMGAVFYRDEGDEEEYVTRGFPFTTDISALEEFMSEQYADGGGDYPEAVHSALDKAINEMQWSDNATARILIHLLDAPPHEEPAVISSLHESIRKSSAKGIRLIPVSASGIDKKTEFLLRSMAILTHGTYVFVTDHSGIGNSHLEPTVGNYEVEFLNDLIVRIINDYGAFCHQEL